MPEVMINGPEGRLEARYHHAEDPNAPIALVLHPHPQHGGTMNNKLVYTVYHIFRARGFSVLRFNFRGVGRSQGRFDHGFGELSDAASALDWMQTINPNAKFCWISGFSFGAWLALTCGVPDERVTRLLGIAPPIGRRSHSVVATSTKPTHFIHGAQDELIPLDALRRFYETISTPKTLTVIENANHLFDGCIAELGDAIQETFAPHLQIEVKI